MRWLGKDIIAASLEELGSLELQEKRWSAGGDEVSSFTEVVERLFTDSGLSDALEKQETGFSIEVESQFRELGLDLKKIDAGRFQEEIIADPAMAKIRETSARILRMLNYVMLERRCT